MMGVKGCNSTMPQPQNANGEQIQQPSRSNFIDAMNTREISIMSESYVIPP